MSGTAFPNADLPRTTPRRIIVSRTDRIGDVVLTLPLCGVLRQALPDARVIFLGSEYTRPVIECSPHVDEVIAWDAVATRPLDEQARFLAAIGAEVILHVAPRREIARAAKRARIGRRIGTSHRLYHWLTCTELVSFTRKRSDLHEAQLNLELARPFIGPNEWPITALAPLTELRPRVSAPGWVAERLGNDRLNLVVHPRSRGSSVEWPLEHYEALITSLDPARFRVFITGSAAEAPGLDSWIETLGAPIVNLAGRLNLDELIAVLRAADGFIGGSTGPLHIAAGAGIHALGLYPARRPMHAGRWAPLGPRAEWLSATRTCENCGRVGACDCMGTITAEMVRARVESWSSA